MLSKSAVVVIKRGDEALADILEKSVGVKSTTPEEIKNVERNYAMMKIARESELQRKIRKANSVYGRKPPLIVRIVTRPLVWLEVIYAMAVCLSEWVLAKGTKLMMRN